MGKLPADHLRFAQYLVPTPERQALFIGAMFGAGFVATNPALVARGYTLSAKAAAQYLALAPVLPALGPDYKLGIRAGTTGQMVRWDQHWMARHYSLPATRGLPIPQFGLGPTAVPNDSSRFIFEMKKLQSGGPRPQSSQQVRKGRSATAARKRGTNQARRRRATSGSNRSKRSRKTPWCWKHRRNHYCVYTKNYK